MKVSAVQRARRLMMTQLTARLRLNTQVPRAGTGTEFVCAAMYIVWSQLWMGVIFLFFLVWLVGLWFNALDDGLPYVA
jgi:hypothetical protein